MKSKAVYLAAALLVLSVSSAASVVINEMELNPPENGADWIEIYQSGERERGYQWMDGRNH